MIEIALTPEVMLQCTEFANKRMDSSKLYAFRGEQNKQKILEDILLGSMGEYGVYTFLREKGIDVAKPDLSIYKSKGKSYAADLSSRQYNVHVKSQSRSSLKRYGHSYLLQKKDPIVTVAGDNDYFVFCACVPSDGLVQIVGVVKCEDVIERYGECKVPSYRHSKVAIYLKDLEEQGVNTWNLPS